jgi:hypothetical protein
MAHGIASSLVAGEQHLGQPGFADSVLSARVELYACLQLLADRARFITGATWAAIALHEDHDFVYCAAAGNSAPVIGSTLDVRTVRPEQALGADGKSLLVTVIRESKTAGFFQLVSTNAEFSDHDLKSIVRLADLVSTAIECMDAEKQTFTGHAATSMPMAATVVAPLEVVAAPKPAIPVLWHASESAASAGSSEPAVESAAAVKIYTCESCGFPVSRGRKFCVDCEARGIPSAHSVTHIFTQSEKQAESWISAHGYTIASILVSALVFAIIYWLR